MHEADPEGCPARAGAVCVRVRMEAELAAAPAQEQPEREVDDDESDRRLGDLLNALRKNVTEEQHGQPECEQRHRVAKAPGEPELGGTARRAFPAARDEGRDGGEVIRVGRMTEPEQHRDGKNHPDRSAVGDFGDSLVQAEHRITSLRA